VELQSTGESRFTEAQGIFDAAEEARSGRAEARPA